MEKHKAMEHMSKTALREALGRMMEEKAALEKRLAGLEEANAGLILKAHELEEQCGEAESRAAAAQSELQALRAAQEEQSQRMESMPLGSLADALVMSQDIVSRTQAAADGYLSASQRRAEEVRAEVESLLCQARERAAGMIREAENRKRLLDDQAQVIRRRLRDEVAGLNQMVLRLEETEPAAQTFPAEEAPEGLPRQAEEVQG